MEIHLCEVYDFKVTGVIGSDLAYAKETVFLNRVILCVTTIARPPIDIELDQRHVDIAPCSLQVNCTTTVITLSVRVSSKQFIRDLDKKPTIAEQSTLFRRILVRVAYLSQDSRLGRGQHSSQLT